MRRKHPNQHPRERELPAYLSPTVEATTASEKRSALKLHAWTAGIAGLLCVFVTVVFIWLGTWPAAVAFGVIGLISLTIFGWALWRMPRRAE
jgi:uncharacterized membrane protein